VVIEKENTTIIHGAGKNAEVRARIETPRKEAENTKSDYDREKLEGRIAKLSGGVAIIKVGAATDSELKEKKARVEDALHATRAAVEEGVVPGGGVAYLRAARALDAIAGANEDQRVGVQIVARALEEPLRQIASNAGEAPDIVVNRVKQGQGAYGFNAAVGDYGDLVLQGIADPAKVARLALQYAASVAGLLLTTEVAAVEAPKEKPRVAASAAAGMDEDY